MSEPNIKTIEIIVPKDAKNLHVSFPMGGNTLKLHTGSSPIEFQVLGKLSLRIFVMNTQDLPDSNKIVIIGYLGDYRHLVTTTGNRQIRFFPTTP